MEIYVERLKNFLERKIGIEETKEKKIEELLMIIEDTAGYMPYYKDIFGLFAEYSDWISHFADWNVIFDWNLKSFVVDCVNYSLKKIAKLILEETKQENFNQNYYCGCVNNNTYYQKETF